MAKEFKIVATVEHMYRALGTPHYDGLDGPCWAITQTQARRLFYIFVTPCYIDSTWTISFQGWRSSDWGNHHKQLRLLAHLRAMFGQIEVMPPEALTDGQIEVVPPEAPTDGSMSHMRSALKV